MVAELDEKLYKDIVWWCETNNLEPLKYIEKSLREHLATDKYGDLNKMVNNTAENTVPKKEEKEKSEIKTADVLETPIIKEEVEDTNAISQEQVIDTPKENKVKRTLKTK